MTDVEDTAVVKAFFWLAERALLVPFTLIWAVCWLAYYASRTPARPKNLHTYWRGDED